MRKFPLISIMLFFAGCESHGEHNPIMKIAGGIASHICKETEFLINLAMLIVFLSAVASGILLWRKTKNILYFWLLCKSASFIFLATVLASVALLFDTKFFIGLAMLIVFLSAVASGILRWRKTKNILYFWLLCQSAFFLVLAVLLASTALFFDTKFFIGLAMLIVFLSAVASGILRWRKTKNILYFWLLCQSAFFLVLANIALFPRFECLYYNKHASTEFFKIKEEKYEDNNSISEYFAISNPPNDTLLLRKIVEEYNFRTIPVDELRKYKRYKREFYRETDCLTRNYEEGKPYPRPQWWLKDFLFSGCSDEYSFFNDRQDIRDHSKGFLMSTYYSYFSRDSGGYWEYGSSYAPDIIIKDIDLFYEENMKESSGTR